MNSDARKTLDHINAQLEREADGYAFKGYLIRYNALHGLAFISKGGAHIGTAPTCRDAERIVTEDLT